MSGKHIFSTVLFGLCLIGLTLSGAAAQTVSLTIDGNAAARYEMSCQVEGGSDGAFTQSGRPPFSRQFDATALSCEIRQSASGGRLDIEARGSQGNVSRTVAAGAGSVAIVRVR